MDNFLRHQIVKITCIFMVVSLSCQTFIISPIPGYRSPVAFLSAYPDTINSGKSVLLSTSGTRHTVKQKRIVEYALRFYPCANYWHVTSGKDTIIQPESNTTIILRVTDEDGLVALDSVHITVITP